jgi:2-polyprenyl-3-methyl-5-hydroxy-6-metoxy-1,4-benzoquinol methylase
MTSKKFNSTKEAIIYLKQVYPIPNYINGQESELFFTSELIQRFVPNRGRLMDCGCGGMNKTALMALLGYEMHGIDDFQDPWHIRDINFGKLKNFADEFNISLKVSNISDPELKYRENYFDGIMIFRVIDHLHESPRNLLNNAGCMVRDGGYLFISMPNAVNLRKRLLVLTGKSNYPSIQSFYNYIGHWRGHIREYTLSDLEYILRKNGFNVLHSGTYHGMIDQKIKSSLLKYFYKTICLLFPTFRDSLIAVAQKPAGWGPVSANPDAFRKGMADFVPKGVE